MIRCGSTLHRSNTGDAMRERAQRIA